MGTIITTNKKGASIQSPTHRKTSPQPKTIQSSNEIERPKTRIIPHKRRGTNR